MKQGAAVPLPAAAGQPYGFGLEVGSKAELMMVMGILGAYPGANLVCNGYKVRWQAVSHGALLGVASSSLWAPWNAIVNIKHLAWEHVS